MTRAEITQAKYDKKYKALVTNLASNHFHGQGGRDKARAFIAEWVGKRCPYCNEIISIYDLELDHKVPMLHPKLKKGLYTQEEIDILSSDGNITGCHKACNRAKGSLDFKEFKMLLHELSIWETSCKIHRSIIEGMPKDPEYKRYMLSPFLGSKQYILTKLKASALKYFGGKK
jgi:5-methylcytosine-specific restriction endonuclease McrA